MVAEGTVLVIATVLVTTTEGSAKKMAWPAPAPEAGAQPANLLMVTNARLTG